MPKKGQSTSIIEHRKFQGSDCSKQKEVINVIRVLLQIISLSQYIEQRQCSRLLFGSGTCLNSTRDSSYLQ
jgi:hypothetical protein